MVSAISIGWERSRLTQHEGSFANSGQTVFAASLYDDHVILSPWEHEHYLENPHLLTEYVQNSVVKPRSC